MHETPIGQRAGFSSNGSLPEGVGEDRDCDAAVIPTLLEAVCWISRRSFSDPQTLGMEREEAMAFLRKLHDEQCPCGGNVPLSFR